MFCMLTTAVTKKGKYKSRPFRSQLTEEKIVTSNLIINIIIVLFRDHVGLKEPLEVVALMVLK